MQGLTSFSACTHAPFCTIAREKFLAVVLKFPEEVIADGWHYLFLLRVKKSYYLVFPLKRSYTY